MFPRGYPFIKSAVAVALLAALWQLTSVAVPTWPGPLRVIGLLAGHLGQPEFQHALLGSVRRMGIGYLLVMAIGISGGLVLGRVPLVDQVLGSLAVAMHAIPGAAWVPLSIIWFGMTERAVIFTIVLGAAGILIVDTDAGIREVPPLIARAARTMGARGVNYFWFVVVPSAIPKIVTGLRLAWAFGWRALMAGELFTSVTGLGQQLSAVSKTGRLDELLALMLLVAVIGIAVDGLAFKRLEHLVRVRWGLA